MAHVKHKLRKAWNEPGHAHFLTYGCYRNYPLLLGDRTRWWVIRALERTRERLDIAVFAYVIMPEHVHVALLPRRAHYHMQDILACLKRQVSKHARQHLEATGGELWLRRLTVRKGSSSVFRFWQAGGGYDRNVWQEKSLQEMVAYIHANPVRRGLVQRPTDWYWSSARFWEGDRSGPLNMDAVDT